MVPQLQRQRKNFQNKYRVNVRLELMLRYAVCRLFEYGRVRLGLGYVIELSFDVCLRLQKISCRLRLGSNDFRDDSLE